jgi:hypothetical protein
MDYAPPQSAVKPKRPIALLVLVPLVAFLAGVGAMVWLLTRWEAGAAMLGIAPQQQAAPVQAAPPPQVTVEPEPAAPAANGATERLLIDPEMTRRVNMLEQRLVDLDATSRQAVGNADRAEGLLVAFAARRALDRGVALGYMEGLLRQRFGTGHPEAVATIMTAARQPVTLQELQDGLQEASPTLSGGGPDQSWWGALKTELGGILSVRRKGTPSTLPSQRLQRANRALEAGLVDVALAEVLRLPGRESAADWIAKARRYVAARRALDTIETAALLEPRTGAAAAPGQPAAAAPAPAQAPAPAPARPSA